MSTLLLLTSALQPSAEVLPALALLGHQVKILPAEGSALLDAPDSDVILVDGRQELAHARDLCRLLRTTGTDCPVLLIVTEGGLAVVAHDWGMDDVVLHTCGPAELEARIRLTTGRLRAGRDEAEGDDHVIRSGEVVVDDATYTAHIGQRALDLTFKEFELLKYLAQHPGRVFTRDQLLQEVWGYDYFGGTRTVDVHVRRLRAKLGPEHETLIGTVRNVGYRFVLPAKETPAERSSSAGAGGRDLGASALSVGRVGRRRPGSRLGGSSTASWRRAWPRTASRPARRGGPDGPGHHGLDGQPALGRAATGSRCSAAMRSTSRSPPTARGQRRRYGPGRPRSPRRRPTSPPGRTPTTRPRALSRARHGFAATRALWVMRARARRRWRCPPSTASPSAATAPRTPTRSSASTPRRSPTTPSRGRWTPPTWPSGWPSRGSTPPGCSWPTPGDGLLGLPLDQAALRRRSARSTSSPSTRRPRAAASAGRSPPPASPTWPRSASAGSSCTSSPTTPRRDRDVLPPRLPPHRHPRPVRAGPGAAG